MILKKQAGLEASTQETVTSEQWQLLPNLSSGRGIVFVVRSRNYPRVYINTNTSINSVKRFHYKDHHYSQWLAKFHLFSLNGNNGAAIKSGIWQRSKIWNLEANLNSDFVSSLVRWDRNFRLIFFRNRKCASTYTPSQHLRASEEEKKEPIGRVGVWSPTQSGSSWSKKTKQHQWPALKGNLNASPISAPAHKLPVKYSAFRPWTKAFQLSPGTTVRRTSRKPRAKKKGERCSSVSPPKGHSVYC